MTKLAKPFLALLSLGVLSHCGPPPEDITLEIETDGKTLVNGAITDLQPAIGRFFNGRGEDCTATLIHPYFALTAARCLSGNQYQLIAVHPDARFELGARSYSVTRVHSFSYGPDQFSISGNRTNDIALLRLKFAVPTSVAMPLRLASREPRHGERLSIFGYGCTTRIAPGTRGTKRYVEFNYPDQTRVLCRGDFGGPVIIGGAHGSAIWAVASNYNGPNSPLINPDVFADVSGHKIQIEDVIRQWHNRGLGSERRGAPMVGFNRSGLTYRTETLGTAHDCRDECYKDSRCRSYSFKHPTLATSGQCYLKDRVPALRPAEGYSAGVAIAFKQYFTFYGGNYRGQRPGLSGKRQCARECYESASCSTWTWSNNYCYHSGQHRTLQKLSSSASNTYAGHKRNAYEENTNRSGGTYRSFTTVSRVTCERSCSQDSSCAAYTHYRNRCQLKNSGGLPSVLPGAYSGRRAGLAMNTSWFHRPSDVLRDFSLATPDPERCQTACARDNNCVAFSYYPPTSWKLAWCKTFWKTTSADSTMLIYSGQVFKWPGSSGPGVWIDDPPHTSRTGRQTIFTRNITNRQTCQTRCNAEGGQAYWWVTARSRSEGNCICYADPGTSYTTMNRVSGLRDFEFYQ